MVRDGRPEADGIGPCHDTGIMFAKVADYRRTSCLDFAARSTRTTEELSELTVVFEWPRRADLTAMRSCLRAEPLVRPSRVRR